MEVSQIHQKSCQLNPNHRKVKQVYNIRDTSIALTEIVPAKMYLPLKRVEMLTIKSARDPWYTQ